jgi:hypothetical protein
MASTEDGVSAPTKAKAKTKTKTKTTKAKAKAKVPGKVPGPVQFEHARLPVRSICMCWHH